MEHINKNSDPKKSKSMLFRLFAGDRSAAKSDDISDEEVRENTVEEIAATGEAAPTPTIVPEEQMPAEAEQMTATEENLSDKAETPTEPAAAAELTDKQEAVPPQEISGEKPDSEKPAPVDAGIEVRIVDEGMEAQVTLTPPKNGGAEVGAKMIRAALKDRGVIYGILDRAMLEISMNKPYNAGGIVVAQGTPKQDGTDAVITENYPREIDISPYQNSDGTVDFKRLSIVREITAGTVIAYQTPATEGTDGTNVRGETVKAKPGKPKTLSRGNNTVISEDGLQLVAEKDGHLAFYGGHFNIDTTFTVEENVDNNTGNIKFSGDVLIKGDVREGYAIHSGGSVRVKGTVEGGSVYADGDICVDGGFNGMKHGELESGKGITSKFLQNCTVRAKGDISSEAVINSIVFCDGQLKVTKDKGVIVGGRCTVLYTVEAKVIGTDVNTPTQIVVGLSPTILAEKQEVEKAIAEVEDSKDMLNKNLIYLERCAKMGKLSDKNLALQDSCNKQKLQIMVREATYRKRLETVTATIEEASAGSMVKAQTVYPSTKITIKSQSVITKNQQQRCIFRMEKGELVTATY